MKSARGVDRSLAPKTRCCRFRIAAVTDKAPATPAKKWGLGRNASSSQNESEQHPPRESEESEEEGWGFFDLSRMGYRWDAPWGAPRVIGGMALWVGSFVGVSFVVVPALYSGAGIDVFKLDAAEKTTFTLINQSVDTIVTLALIRLLTGKGSPQGTRALSFRERERGKRYYKPFHSE